MNEAIKALLAAAPPQVTIIPSGNNATVIRHAPVGADFPMLRLVPLFRYFGLDVDQINFKDAKIQKQIQKVYEWASSETDGELGSVLTFIHGIDGKIGLQTLDGLSKLSRFYNYAKIKEQFNGLKKEVESYHTPETTHQVVEPTQMYETSNNPQGAISE